jgi:hypothetical protein
MCAERPISRQMRRGFGRLATLGACGHTAACMRTTRIAAPIRVRGVSEVVIMTS